MKRLLSVGCLFCVCLAVFTIGASSADAKGKTCLCHIPPGSPDDAHTICVGPPAVKAHLAHGDTMGACPVVCGGTAGNTCKDTQFCKREEGQCSPDASGICTDLPPTCQGVLDPVCGCDGKTYDNACLAGAAGVTVQHGCACAAATTCGGSTGGACDQDQFCKPAEGQCDPNAQGICVTFPGVCPSTLAPVCGCDGTTYSNACYADVAGVPVASEGACPVGGACGGSEGGTCMTGQFCKPPEGVCAEGAPGVCMVMPPICSKTAFPVCGCDGKTYNNPCLADAAGIPVAHEGACEGSLTFCGGFAGDVCAQGQVCKFPEGSCQPGPQGACQCIPDEQGVCQDIPALCPGILAPVCGCNGTTFSNACIADASGVPVTSDGRCVPPRACGGATQPACLEGEYCQRPPGACAADAPGVCAQRPQLCRTLRLQVCGCDGMTYFNVCFAAAAGVNVSSFGPCPPPQ